MKKYIVFPVLAAALLATSCTKTENFSGDASEAAKGEKCTLYVQGNEWTADSDSRSSFNPASGISLSGTELIGLFYKEDGKMVGSSGNYAVKAEPAGAGVYTFTNPGADAASPWYSLMPYTHNGIRSTPSASPTSTQFRIGPTQYPGDNTFDPMADVLAGKPFTTSDGTGTITAFKRLTAPVRIDITGLEDGEKIYAATLKFSGNATTYTNTLVGQLNPTISDSYADTKVTNVTSTTVGRALSVIYGNGLPKNGSSWPMWITLNPITLEAGTTLTLEVTTANKTYTRTITLDGAKELVIDKINTLGVNMKGEGFSSAETLLQDFTKQAVGSGTLNLTASDGSAVSWTAAGTSQWTAASDDGGSMHPNALKMPKASKLTIPTISGKKILKLRLFLHPCSSISTTLATIALKDGSNTLSTVANAALITKGSDTGGYYNGGIIDIDLPAGYDSMSGLTLEIGGNVVVASAITMWTANLSYDPNDLYSVFTSGADLKIGHLTFNNATHTATKIKIYQSTTAELKQAVLDYNVVFLDYDSADATEDKITMEGSIAVSKTGTATGHAIIGRYVNHQPLIDFGEKYYFYQQTDELAVKNVSLKFPNYGFWASAMESALGTSVEDCTIAITATNKYLFYDSKDSGTIGFREVHVKNCVIGAASTGYVLFGLSNRTTTGDEHTALEILDFENNVIYYTGTGTSGAKQIFLNPKDKVSSNYISCPNVKINFSHNSVYNYTSFWVGVKNPKQINLDYNVGQSSLTANCYMLSINESGFGALDPGTSTDTYNHLFNSNTENTFSFTDMTAAVRPYFTRKTLTQAKANSGDASPFSSINTTTGYLPINTSVVANGSGATYTDKLWRTWE